MITAELLPLIDPAINPKYSPNLYAWIKKYFLASASPITATKPDSLGLIRVGVLRETNWISGARLNDVLCNGRKAKNWDIVLRHMGDTHNIDGTFWER